MAGRTPAPQRSYGGRTAEERRADRRERLLTAGLELFGTRGYSGTSIERLCSAAGVSTRNFYEEFSGREALLTALHLRLNESSRRAVAQAYAAAHDADLADRVQQTVRAYVTASAGDARAARINYVEVIGVSADMEARRHELRELWTGDILSMIRDAVERGEAEDRDYRLTVVAIVGATNNLVHHWSARGRDIPLDTVTAELSRMILALLTP